MAEQTKTRRGPLAWVKRHKKLMIFLVIVLAIALVITNVVRKANKAAAGTTYQYVRTTVLQKTTLSDSVSVNGTVKSGSSASVTASDSVKTYKVTVVNVAVGDTVKKGDVIATLDTTDVEKQIANAELKLSDTQTDAQKSYDQAVEDQATDLASARADLEEAQKKLEAAQKNLDNCSAVAPISGQVIGLSVTPGQELQANSTLVTISDTSTVTVSATVDERNISYIKTGMSVNLDQWGTSAFGTVETVSLSSTVNNGVASYPITISADNTDGNLQVNSYVNYQIQASQNDNCLMVPIQAVRTVGLEDGSSATVVYVQADSRPDNALELPYQDEEIPSGFYPVQVEIGIQDTYNVEIKSGVNDGDTVFTQMITDQAWG